MKSEEFICELRMPTVKFRRKSRAYWKLSAKWRPI